MELVSAINCLAAFCGPRALPELTPTALATTFGLKQADAVVLFGGSILAGGDLFAHALQAKLAKTSVIVGGVGHTTAALQATLGSSSTFSQSTEAELFAAYLEKNYQLQPDFLETASTNCGNNITNLLNLLQAEQRPVSSLILIQDATMQRRMSATLKKFAPHITAIDFASYHVTVSKRNGRLYFQDPPLGMWVLEHYLSLLLGEIPRLRDDANGYGPQGKNYLAHVTIPPEVEAAFTIVKNHYPQLVRKADPKYKS